MKRTLQSLLVVLSLTAAVSVVTFTSGCAGDKYSRSTGETLDDSSITAKVKSEMLADPDVSGMAVKVDTYRGQVQLTGFVDTIEQKQRAEQIARGVNGVQFVNNDIIVKTQEPAGAARGTKDSDLDVDVDVDKK